MNPDKYDPEKKTGSPGLKERSNRDILEDIDARLTRVETKVTNIALHSGLDADGKPKKKPAVPYNWAGNTDQPG